MTAQPNEKATVRARPAMACACCFHTRVDDGLVRNIISLVLLVHLCVASKKSYGRCMSAFDYTASAELWRRGVHVLAARSMVPLSNSPAP